MYLISNVIVTFTFLNSQEKHVVSPIGDYYAMALYSWLMNTVMPTQSICSVVESHLQEIGFGHIIIHSSSLYAVGVILPPGHKFRIFVRFLELHFYNDAPFSHTR